ncbi:hypothetical protein V1509DRAFT_630036 [Lipomyces kononenkoae]
MLCEYVEIYGWQTKKGSYSEALSNCCCTCNFCGLDVFISVHSASGPNRNEHLNSYITITVNIAQPFSSVLTCSISSVFFIYIYIFYTYRIPRQRH